MKQYWGLFWATTALAMIVAALLIWGDVDPTTVIGAVLGFVAFFWLLVVVTVPWNLYFAARQVRHRVDSTLVRGIPVPPERAAEVLTLSRRLLGMAIGAHVVSALVAVVVAAISGYMLGYYVAGFFLASIVLRPAAAYFVYLRARIVTISDDIAFPPDDIAELRRRVVAVDDELTAWRERTQDWHDSDERQIDDLRDSVRRQDERAREEQRMVRETVARDHAELLGRANAVDQRVAGMVTHFDAALDGVTDQQEIIAGLRAFARLMHSH
ncbi:hypothetical protein HLB23_32735 [Nocardia uniformis]|uniref:Uncharacterized protein n=2 Tax=Nocardia uniformis TaxID=53432 RepID=A0A849CJH0_9NOCA|nr:hypothetical protein [Nocardia uniformis]NNH74561.1 hypothetical protein [Nocardia uniformis]